MSKYAEILLPLAQPLYTYSTAGLDVHPGEAVAVQLGKNSVYTGIVWSVTDTAPVYRCKSIIASLYDSPLLSPSQMKLWEWISEYYMCPLGDVMRAALPASVKPHAKDESEFEPYFPPKEKFLYLTDIPSEVVLDKLSSRSPRQAEVVRQLLDGPVSRKKISQDSAVINALIKKGMIDVEYRDIVLTNEDLDIDLPELTAQQAMALDKLREAVRSVKVSLLHGVTSSGKTLVYAHLIREVLREGKDVLFLTPEITLSSQMELRLTEYFSDRVNIYHSAQTPQQRTKLYTQMLHSMGGNLILGARSALFLPYRRLGLIIVDEEHDSSYYQQEPNPRYNGRDLAIVLAKNCSAGCVLGSATPSLESYLNAYTGKYQRVELSERFGGILPPRIIVSDSLRSMDRWERRKHFNKELLDAIKESLERKEQVILFQNRRGYTTHVGCEDCGWVAKCRNCNVTMVRHGSLLKCHYCGAEAEIPSTCPQCHSAGIKASGFGTEKVEDEIAKLFPEARVLRLDGDTATSATAYKRIISSFASGEADILVGTQIVTKGLDFEKVTLIGILNADNLLNQPDFRASERAWQTLLQVSGRAGRRDIQGKVIIQTTEIMNPVISKAEESKYDEVAKNLLSERKLFNYPPYSHYIVFTLKSKDSALLSKVSEQFSQQLRARFSTRASLPQEPLVNRIRENFIVQISLKIELKASLERARQIIREERDALYCNKEYRKVQIVISVDPK